MALQYCYIALGPLQEAAAFQEAAEAPQGDMNVINAWQAYQAAYVRVCMAS